MLFSYEVYKTVFFNFVACVGYSTRYVKIDAFFHFVTVFVGAIPLEGWVGEFAHGIAPTVYDDALKSTEATVEQHLEVVVGAVAIWRKYVW